MSDLELNCQVCGDEFDSDNLAEIELNGMGLKVLICRTCLLEDDDAETKYNEAWMLLKEK